MTQRSLFRRTLGVIAVYAVAIGLGIYLRVIYPGPASLAYETYKDLIPLIIAMPAAYLAFAFQRRTSYVQALRALWSTMVTAVQGARTYVRTDTPTRELYDQTLAGLSIAIEEARAVFKLVSFRADQADSRSGARPGIRLPRRRSSAHGRQRRHQQYVEGDARPVAA
jgi:hypothetical protein